MAIVNLETLTNKTLYFPLNLHFRMIYNPDDKLKQIPPVKSDQLKDCIINGVMDSSILPEIFSCHKMFIMQWRNEIKRMGSYTELS